MADALLDHFVHKARAEGLTWSQIGEVLDVSKQAAQQRSTRLFKSLSSQVADKIAGLKPSMPVFHRFTARARTSVAMAHEVANDLGHGFLGTEHLLVGLFRAGGVASEALTSAFGVTEETVMLRIEEKVGRGTGAETPKQRQGRVTFTPKAKKTLERSLQEALKLGHDYIGTEHILLAIMSSAPDAVARVILEEAGVEPDRLRATVQTLLREKQAANRGEPGAEQG